MKRKKYKPRKKEPILQRLMRRSNIPLNKNGTNSKSQCWIWTGPTNNAGYGMMKVNAELNMATVHRIMMVEHYGTITYGDKTQVLHECGNKLCINPDHLKLGTIKDRADLQRKYKAYNKNFHNPEYMWRTCEHCNGVDYLPHFKRKHALCDYNATHKYIANQIHGNLNEK